MTKNLLFRILVSACFCSATSAIFIPPSKAWDNNYCNMDTYLYYQSRLGPIEANSFMSRNYGCDFTSIQAEGIKKLQTKEGASEFAGALFGLMELMGTPRIQKQDPPENEIRSDNTLTNTPAAPKYSREKAIAFLRQDQRKYDCSNNQAPHPHVTFTTGIFEIESFKVPRVKIDDTLVRLEFQVSESVPSPNKLPVRSLKWEPTNQEMMSRAGYSRVEMKEDFNKLTATYEMIDPNGKPVEGLNYTCSAIL